MEPPSPGENEPPPDITRLLQEGGERAHEELLELVYAQLRRIAQNRRAAERPDHTLQATELVHEAYLKMVPGLDDRGWENRGQFYSAAAEAMRRILVDHARKRGSTKRGGNYTRVPLDVLDLAQAHDPRMILDLNDAADRLEEFDTEVSKVFRLRFFAGLTNEEVAKAIEVSKRTVIRHWVFARAWILDALES